MPDWAAALNARRVLWQQYGIPFSDAELEDVVLALKLNAAEVTRHNNQARR